MKIAFTRYDALALGLVAVVATLGMDAAFADTTGFSNGTNNSGFATGTNSGAGFVTGIKEVIQGNIGLAAGIAFAALGAYLWLVKQETGAGIGAILFGALLALVPNLLDTLYSNITQPIITTMDKGATGGASH